MFACNHYYLIYHLVVLMLHEFILTSKSPWQVLVSVIVYYGQRLLIVRCDMKEQTLTRWCLPVAWVRTSETNCIAIVSGCYLMRHPVSCPGETLYTIRDRTKKTYVIRYAFLGFIGFYFIAPYSLYLYRKKTL